MDSPFDVDSRWSRKRDTTWRGYKVHLSETCDTDTPHLIIHLETTPATDADNATRPAINTGLAERDPTPAEHYLDEGYLTAQAIHRAAAPGHPARRPAHQGLVLAGQSRPGLRRDSFHINFHTRTAVCPGGKTSTTWRPHAHNGGPGTVIAFAETDCQPCPLRANCTTSTSAGRQIVIPARELYEIQRSNRTAQHDPHWKQRDNTRAGIEGTISQATRAHHLRHCRYTGLAKARVQHVLTACGVNAARIADWTHRDNQPAPTRPPSPFKILCQQLTAS